ncbi:hypothetical protein Tco_0023135, partial [Tanacetum coccineum]
FIYGSSWKGEMAREAKRSLDKSSEGSGKVFPAAEANLRYYFMDHGTDIQKESQRRPNQARDGKDKVNPKPKSVKVKSQPHEENTT